MQYIDIFQPWPSHSLKLYTKDQYIPPLILQRNFKYPRHQGIHRKEVNDRTFRYPKRIANSFQSGTRLFRPSTRPLLDSHYIQWRQPRKYIRVYHMDINLQQEFQSSPPLKESRKALLYLMFAKDSEVRWIIIQHLNGDWHLSQALLLQYSL